MPQCNTQGNGYGTYKGLTKEQVIQDMAGAPQLESPKKTLVQTPQEWRAIDPKTNIQNPNWSGKWQRVIIGRTKSKWRSFEHPMFSAWEPYKIATLDDEHTIKCMQFPMPQSFVQHNGADYVGTPIRYQAVEPEVIDGQKHINVTTDAMPNSTSTLRTQAERAYNKAQLESTR